MKQTQRSVYQPHTIKRHPAPRRQAAPRKSRFKYVVVLAIIGLAGFALLKTSRSVVSKSEVGTTATQYQALGTSLNAVIAAQTSLRIGIAVLDLQNGSSASYGSTVPFDAASTTKLLTAAAFLNRVEQGKSSLGEQVGNYNAQFQLQQMVQQSNNISWDLLTSEVGYAKLETYAHSIGLTSYKVADNTITPADMAVLLQKLYTGKLLNASHTKLLLSYMQNTNDETMIPASLPAGVTAYHKYGLLDGAQHDVGIITRGDRSIIEVIYTSGADNSDQDERAALVQSLSRQIITSLLPTTTKD